MAKSKTQQDTQNWSIVDKISEATTFLGDALLYAACMFEKTPRVACFSFTAKTVVSMT